MCIEEGTTRVTRETEPSQRRSEGEGKDNLAFIVRAYVKSQVAVHLSPGYPIPNAFQCSAMQTKS